MKIGCPGCGGTPTKEHLDKCEYLPIRNADGTWMLPKSLSFIEVIGDPNPKVDVVQKGNLDGEVPEFIDQLREFGDEWGRIGNSEEAH